MGWRRTATGEAVSAPAPRSAGDVGVDPARPGMRPPGPAGPWLGLILAGCVLTILTVAYFWPILRPFRPLSLGGDFAAQTYPWRLSITRLMFRGQLPHWAPEVSFGFPLLADIETTVFYPPSVLVSLLAGPAVSYRVLEVQAIVHYLIAGLGMWLLLRRIGTGWLGALVGAVAFMFSGFLWAHSAHLTVVQSASWGPWVLLGAAALLDRPTGPAVAGTGIALTLAILGGHPQIPYYLALALLVTLCLGYRARDPASASRPRVGSMARSAAAALLVAGGLSAVQLLPTAVLTRESIRWHAPGEWLVADSLPVENLVTLLIPMTFHGTSRWTSVDEFHAYMGIVPLLLAAWALTRLPSRWALVFGSLSGLALLVACGVPALVWLGGIGLFRIPARTLYLFDLAVAGLAGLGIDALLRPARDPSVAERRLMRAIRIGAGVATVGGAWLAVSDVPTILREAVSPAFPAHYFRFLALLLGSVLALELARRWPRRRQLAGGLLVAVLLADVFSFPRLLAWSGTPPDGHWPGQPALTRLAANLGPHRVLNDRLFGRALTMEANLGLIYDLPLTTVYSSLVLARTQALIDRLGPELPVAPRVYDLLGLGWVVSERDVGGVLGEHPSTAADPEAGGPALRLERRWRGVWAVADALPRAFLPDEVRVIRDKQRLLDEVMTIDPRRTVVLTPKAPACPSRLRRGAASRDARFLVDEPSRVRLRVDADQAGPLVLSDTFYPGWRATVDGAPVPIARANYLFREVCVPDGQHIVEFTFHQPGYLVGLVLSALSGVATVLLLTSGRLKARSRQLGGALS